MASFELHLDTDNAAFGETAAKRSAEVARILRVAADKIEDERIAAPLYDSNGNRVGQFVWDIEESDEH